MFQWTRKVELSTLRPFNPFTKIQPKIISLTQSITEVRCFRMNCPKITLKTNSSMNKIIPTSITMVQTRLIDISMCKLYLLMTLGRSLISIIKSTIKVIHKTIKTNNWTMLKKIKVMLTSVKTSIITTKCTNRFQ